MTYTVWLCDIDGSVWGTVVNGTDEKAAILAAAEDYIARSEGADYENTYVVLVFEGKPSVVIDNVLTVDFSQGDCVAAYLEKSKVGISAIDFGTWAIKAGKIDKYPAYLATSVLAYIECAIFTDKEEGAEDPEYISLPALSKALNDVARFRLANDRYAAKRIDAHLASQIGHDLWLTRNGHGTGFWDRDCYLERDNLTAYANEMGEERFLLEETIQC